MAGFEDVVNSTDLADVTAPVVEALGPDVGIWKTVEGERVLIAGREVDGPAKSTITGLCRATIEVVADADQRLVDMAAALLVEVSDRLEIEDRARRSRRRLSDSERIGALGTYSWDAPTGELEWTDGLFRIYGYEPGAFEPSYERFKEHLHPEDRDRMLAAHEHSMRTGEPFETEERIIRPDGEVRTLWSIGEVRTDDEGRPVGIVGVCRDVTEQREAERRVADADLRRRQALELNDNVIQGLVSLLWQLDEGEDGDEARRITEATLSASRRIVTDLLRDVHDPDTGKLVRQAPPDLEHVVEDSEELASAAAAAAAADHLVPIAADRAERTGPLRVVIADDLPALRMLLRMRLSKEDDLEVVGEACDGQEVVDLVDDLRPDVVVMDLSMPVLDGIQATRRIVRLAPETRVVVLSGYPAESMAEEVQAAGAECYIEKSSNLDELCAAILTSPRTATRPLQDR